MLRTINPKRPVVLGSPEFLSGELAGHVDYIPVSALGGDDADFLLIVVPDNTKEAGRVLAGSGGDPDGLVSACRRRGLPIVFWALGIPGVSDPWVSLCRSATLCYGATKAAQEWINTLRNDTAARELKPGVAPHRIQPIQDISSIPAKIEKLRLAITQDPPGWIRQRHAAHKVWRRSMSEECWGNRIARIRDDLGRAPVDPWPLVTLYVATMRPHLLDSVVETFNRQTYPNCELVVVFHSNDPTIVRRSERQFAAHKNIRFLQVPRSISYSYCLNAAIDEAQGLYSMKMDDDDFYAPNYVLDMILPLRAVDVDIFGKPMAFIFFEASNETRLVLRAPLIENSVGSASHLIRRDISMAGPTISGRTGFIRQVRFSETSNGAVDHAFYEHGDLHDARIGIWDMFNFCYFRSANKNHHTWRDDKEYLKNAGRFIGPGRCYADYISL